MYYADEYDGQPIQNNDEIQEYIYDTQDNYHQEKTHDQNEKPQHRNQQISMMITLLNKTTNTTMMKNFLQQTTDPNKNKKHQNSSQ